MARKKLEKEVENSDKLHKKIYKDKNPDADQPKPDNALELSEEPEPSELEPVIEPEVDPEPEVEVETPELETPDDATAQLQKELEKERHKFKTLQGKYNAEVPQLHKKVKELRGQAEQAVEPKPPVESKPELKPSVELEHPTSTNVLDVLSSDERDEWGPDMLDVISRVSQAVYEKAAGENKEQLEQIRSKIESMETLTQANSADDFFIKLTMHVSDWESINLEEDFKSWLTEPDGLSGATRLENATTAFNTLNVDAAARYFDTYKTRKKTKVSQNTASEKVDKEVQPKPIEQSQENKDEIVQTAKINISPSKSKQTADENLQIATSESIVAVTDLREAFKKVRAGLMTEDDYDKLRRRFAEQLKKGEENF